MSLGDQTSLCYSLEDFAEMDKFFKRNLINSLSGFKSLNLVGTVSQTRLTNLAVFSQVFHVGASPALMGLLVRPDSVPRHTLSNILDTGFFTLNHVREEFYQAAHQTSARYEESEFEAVGLSPEFGARLPAPYVKESHIKIGLKFEERIDIQLNGTVLIIGSVQELFLPAQALSRDGWIDLEAAGTLTSSGLDAYHKTSKIARLSYAKPKQTPSVLQ